MLRRLLDIADHHHIDVRWRRVPSGGACIWVGDTVEVVVDPTLTYGDQVDVLAHELGHALAGRPVDRWAAELLRHVLDARCERQADEMAADLTVDLDELERIAAVVHDLDGTITDGELAAELGVPVRYARIAIERTWGCDVARRRRGLVG